MSKRRAYRDTPVKKVCLRDVFPKSDNRGIGRLETRYFSRSSAGWTKLSSGLGKRRSLFSLQDNLRQESIGICRETCGYSPRCSVR